MIQLLEFMTQSYLYQKIPEEPFPHMYYWRKKILFFSLPLGNALGGRRVMPPTVIGLLFSP